jgi:hypothetical protein
MAAGYLDFAGRSMAPLLRDGDKIALTELQVLPAIGNVIAYSTGSSLVVHRVVAIDRAERRIVTRGDASADDDCPINMIHVIGQLAGLYDPVEARTIEFPLIRRIWCKIMQTLVRLERGRWRPAVLAGYAARVFARIV